MTKGLWLLAICAGAMLRRSGDWRYPLTMDGESCPNPIEPMLYIGQPIGMFHCSWCGDMQVAGFTHTDFSCSTLGCGQVIHAEVKIEAGVPHPQPENGEWHPYCKGCVSTFEAAGYEIRQEF